MQYPQCAIMSFKQNILKSMNIFGSKLFHIGMLRLEF